MTVAPGINIERIDTRESAAAGEDGEALIPGTEDVTPDLIEDRLGTDHDRLHYTLNVKAATEAAAKVKSRIYVRAKNPFEPSIINVASSKKVDDGTVLNTYVLGVGVSKSGFTMESKPDLSVTRE